MSYAQLYAQAICRICVQRGITPEQLADLCGVTPLTMKRILSGTTRHARVGTMRRIAAALDISDRAAGPAPGGGIAKEPPVGGSFLCPYVCSAGSFSCFT